MTDLALAFALAIGFLYWATRPVRKYTHSEWIAAMKKQKLGVK